MRTVPSAQATRLATGSAKTAWCYKATTKTGVVYRYTEGDVAATFGGDGTYAPYPGLLGGAIQYGLDGQASSLDIQLGVTSSTPITRGDVRDGLFDGAEWDVFEYDLDAPADGRVQVMWGRTGDVQRRREGGVKFNVKGILNQAYEVFVQHYHPMCIWYFCDTRCGLDPAAFTYAATIIAISADRYTLTISGPAAARPDDVFKDGVASVTSGARNGVNIAVRGNTGATLLMHLATPVAVQVGDTLSILQGCQKRAVDCKAYGNYLRFGGQDKAGTPEEAASITYSQWAS